MQLFTAVELGDEIKDPSRNIPRSFIIAIPTVTLIYLLLGIVTGGVRKWGGTEVNSLAEDGLIPKSLARHKQEIRHNPTDALTRVWAIYRRSGL